MALSKTNLTFIVIRCEPELIVPEKPNPHEIKQLSDIDNQQGLRFQVPFLFFYPPPAEGKNHRHHLIDPISSIREALARTLSFYYPFAGRIMEGADRKLRVECNNEGVLFVEAEANVKLEQLDHGILPTCPYMNQLLFEVPDSQGIIGCPILLFQVTRFICGGFSVGIRLNHTVADGYGLTLFLNTISECILKGVSRPSIAPVWRRDLLNARSPPTITCTHNEFQLTNTEQNQNMITMKPLIYPQHTFTILTSVLFGPDQIQALRNHLPPTTTSFSRFDLITACLWRCRTVALGPHPDDVVRISVVMNVRRRIKKEIDLTEGYYGNGIVYPAAVTTAGDLCGSSLLYALELVRGAKAQLSGEYVRSVADLMGINGGPSYVTRWNYIVSDLTGLGLDKIDLGWGKPVYGGVPCATPVISFYSTLKDEKGEDVGVVAPVCLPAMALEKFHYEVTNMTT